MIGQTVSHYYLSASGIRLLRKTARGRNYTCC